MAEVFFRIDGLKEMQTQFEQISGTDKSIYEHNTPEFILARGVIGEAVEALEALAHGSLYEAKLEAVDIAIFLSSLFMHLNMTADEVEQIAKIKMSLNFTKYDPAHFEGRTVAEGIAYSRKLWAEKHQAFTTAYSDVLLSNYEPQEDKQTAESGRGSS